MGGGYAKMAEPASQMGGEQQSHQQQQQRSAHDDGDATPRTENEEIAKQAELSKSPHTSGAGPPSAARGNSKASKYANMRIKWADQQMGGPPQIGRAHV